MLRTRRFLLEVLSLLLAFPLAALGQEAPYLVRDLPGVTVHSSMPQGHDFWVNTGNITWFTAMTASGGREVFKTDGTEAGTIQVTHGTGVPESQYNGPYLGLVNGKVIYGGIDAGGPGVFALDTSGGAPVLLRRFQLASLTNGIVRNDVLYFSARPDTGTEYELWKTDGTPSATTKIDLLPGDQGTFNGAGNTSLYLAGSWIYFFGTTPQGAGLHRTDGTAENTLLLLPVSTTTLATGIGRVAVLEDRVIFSLAPNSAETNLWASDGTAAGTTLVAGPLWVPFSPIAVFGGNLLFENLGLWSTDGTPDGTHVSELAKIRGELFATTGSAFGGVTGNHLIFFRNDFLYVTDGTAAGTQVSFPRTRAGGAVGFILGKYFYYGGLDNTFGVELWRTDGTSTEMVDDINRGDRWGLDNSSLFDTLGFVRPDGTALFAATDFHSGREPWITDGTAAGTHILKNIATDDPPNGSSPSLLSAAGSKIFFQATVSGTPAIGTSDGTYDGTRFILLDDLRPNPIDFGMAANNRYFFRFQGAIYSSDGTTAGTTLLSTVAAPWGELSNGILLESGGDDVWFSDGTLGGTRKLHTFDPVYGWRAFPGGSVAWITSRNELWKTDGTVAGTVQVPLNPAPTGDIDAVLDTGARVYFITNGSQLWRADRDGSNVAVVTDLANFSVTFVGATAHRVYLDVGGKLFSSDGTQSGTISLPVNRPSSYRPCPGAPAALGDTLLFISQTDTSGDVPPPTLYGPQVTLWRSDGTVAGTTALHTMLPPTFDDDCHPVVALGSTAYYTGWDSDHGWELWQTDGTASGTRLTADIYPGPQGSLPQELTLAGSHLFFSADSPNIGRELWAVGPLPARKRAARP